MNAKTDGRKVPTGGRPILEFSFRTDDLNEIPVKFAPPIGYDGARHYPNAIRIDPGSELGGDDFNIG
jgi:hypothetical protein